MKNSFNPLPLCVDYLNIFEQKLPALSGYIYTILAHLCFSLSDFFIKRSISVPHSQAYFVATLGITMILYFTLNRQKQTPATKSPRINLFLVILGLVSGTSGICLFYGFHYVPLSEGVVTLQFGPALTSILAVLFLKESYDWLQFFSTILSSIGVVFILKPPFIFDPNTVNIENNDERIVGALAILVSAIVLSFLPILQKKVMTAQIAPTISAFYISLIPTLFASFLQITGEVKILNLDELMILGGNIVSACIAQVLINRAFKFVEAGKISLLGYMQIFFAYLLDIFVIGTKVDFLSVIGSGFIFGCVFLRIYKTMQQK